MARIDTVYDDKLKALNTVVRKEFSDGLSLGEDSYKKIAMIVASAGDSNTYSWLSQFPKIKEWLDQRVAKGLSTSSYQIFNKLWESTLSVRRTDLEDDNIGMVPLIAKGEGEAIATHFNQEIFNLLANGDKNACYDGQNFFDLEHPVIDAAGVEKKISNLADGGDTAWYLLSLSGVFKPLILQQRLKAEIENYNKDRYFSHDEVQFGIRARHNFGYGLWQQAYKSKKPLTAENLEAGIKAIAKNQKDGGVPLGLKATHLVVPQSLEADGLKLVAAATGANGASNINYKRLELLATNYLS